MFGQSSGALHLAEQYELSCGYAWIARDMYIKLRPDDKANNYVARVEQTLALNAYALGKYELAYYYVDRVVCNRRTCYKTNIHPDYAASLNLKGLSKWP